LNAEYEKEIAALRLLNRDWDAQSEDDRRGKHHTFMWTIDAAVKVGLVQFPTESKESKVAEPRCCAACSGFDGEEGYTDCMSALNRRRLPMVKTEEQKAAWLDGYRAATDTAASFKVRVDGGEVDEALNLGARMVASLLTRNVEKFTVPKERLE